MFENQNHGIIVQTEDLLLRKESDAAGKIGNHLLVTAFYKKGAVIGNRFDKRQNEERQWIKKINSTSLIIGLGQYGSFDSFCHQADLIKSSVTGNYLPERYMTLPVYHKFLATLAKTSYDEGRPIPLDIIYANVTDSKIKMVRFNGDSDVYYGFGVLGGYGFQAPPVPLTKEETEGKNEQEIMLLKEKKFGESLKFPVKDAIKKMESFYGNKKYLGSMDEAMDAVRTTMFECDIPSKKELFEFTVFENGEFESVYVERGQQKK